MRGGQGKGCMAATLAISLVMLAPACAPGSTAAAPEVPMPSWLEPYRAPVARILAAARQDDGAWAKLEALCVDIGHRLSGSPGMDRAVAWALDALRQDGHENVRAEPVMVPKWVRGEEALVMTAPRTEALGVLGLGGTVGTPPEGVEGEVVVVADEAELERRKADVAGKIVLFNNPMPDYHPEHGSGYGTAVRFRLGGPRLVGPLGARAVLVRSVTARSLATPHTGATSYRDVERPIPAAAITVEGAELIAGLARRGQPVRVRLTLGGRDEGMVPSANVVGELVGRERPDEVVVIGAHLDTWDVGQGAHDDGTGVVMAMQALTLLRRLGLRPRRTIRAVLFANEENGLEGASAYARDHAAELPRHVAALESDSGGFQPRGYRVEHRDEARAKVAQARLAEILRLLEPIGATATRVAFSGADIRPMKGAGVPLLGHWVDGSRYFDYHHTAADTIDKVDPDELKANVATMAAVAWVLAEMPGRLGDPRETR